MNAGPGRPVHDAGAPFAELAQHLDARLVPTAIVVWLVSWLALDFGPMLPACVAAVLALVVAAATRSDRRATAAVLLAAGVAAVCAGVLAVRLVVRDASPLIPLAANHARVVLRLQVTDDPRLLTAGLGPPTDIVNAKVGEVWSGGRHWRTADDVVIFAPAATWSALVPSQRVTAEGRVTESTSPGMTVATFSARGPPAAIAAPSAVQRVAGRLRSGLRDAAAVLPTASRGLLPGLVDGDVSRLPASVAADFKTTGLTHLVAVSGTNVAIVAGAVLLAARGLRCGPRTCAALAGLAILGFVVLARPSPSVLRAAVMGGIALGALASGRTRAATPALAASVVILLVVEPDLGRSVGFAMSVAATAALLVLAPPLGHGLRRRGVPAGLAEALAVPVAANVATAPLIASISGQVSLVAIPANLFAAVAVAPATVLGVLAAVTAPVVPWFATGCAWLAGWPTRWLVAVATDGARLPDAVVGWPAGARGALLLAGIAVAGWAVFGRSSAFRRLGTASALAAGMVIVPIRFLAPGWPPAGWFAVACDIGQGDGLVLRAGPDSGVVVDTGPDPVAENQCLRSLHIRSIPLMLITHLHADHVGGVSGAMHDRSIGAMVTGPLEEPVPAWHTLVSAAASRGITVSQPQPGTVLRAGTVTLTVLGPQLAYHGTRSDPNNSSLVTRAEVDGHTLLLPGDAEIDAQQALLTSGVDLRAEIYKVTHHGSAYFDPRFVAAIGARTAVISVGAGNDYGLPAPSLVDELHSRQMSIYRTDQDGDVGFVDNAGALMVVKHHPALANQQHVAVGAVPSSRFDDAASPGRRLDVAVRAAWVRRATMRTCRPPSSRAHCASSSATRSYSPAGQWRRSRSPPAGRIRPRRSVRSRPPR